MPKDVSVFKKYTQDSPIWRVPMDQLPSSELEAFLTKIRELRLQASQKYKEVVNRRAAARSGKLAERLSDQIRMFQKDLAQLDKVIEKVDKRITTIIAVRLELQDLQPYEVKTWMQELEEGSDTTEGDQGTETD
jgi:predicted component of type VI protein secretion system